MTEGFACRSDSEESACNAGDLGLIPGWKDSLEKGMATYSSILAWRILWTKEPGGLQSMGSQRVGHDTTERPRSVTNLESQQNRGWPPAQFFPRHPGFSLPAQA